MATRALLNTTEHTMSTQVTTWREHRKRIGGCIYCRAKAVSKNMCQFHLDYHRQYRLLGVSKIRLIGTCHTCVRAGGSCPTPKRKAKSPLEGCPAWEKPQGELFTVKHKYPKKKA